jgi:nucleoside-diphosphate-sugar epimerase
MKKILIIGSEGATGISIFKTLSMNKNYSIYRIGRKPPLFNDDKYLLGDIDDYKFCCDIKNKHHFDVVIYLAGVWRGKNTSATNFLENYNPFNNFINTIAKSASQVVFFSSSLIYTEQDFLNEQLTANIPSDTYSMAKYFSEHLLVNNCSDKPYVIFRPFHIVSPYEVYRPGRSHVITDLIYKINNNIKFDTKGFNEVQVPFTWVYDIGAVIDKVIGNLEACNQIYNIGSDTYSLMQLVDTINHCLDTDKSFEENNSGISSNSVPYFDKSKKIFGDYSRTTLSEMVKICINNGKVSK